MAVTTELAVFAHLGGDFVPAGLLDITEEGAEVLASRFRYGLRYLDRPNALEIDPVSLGLQNRDALRGVALFPREGLSLFGGLRDAAPDAWGRRVIENRLHVPLNGLPESIYLLEAGSDRVGALDIRQDINSPTKAGKSSLHRLQYLLEAAERIEAGETVPAALEDIFDAGSSLGGMRPKASVRDDNETLWLAKFPSRGDALNVPMIEAATLRLAGQCGLTIPEVMTQEIGGKTVMLIRRFDREWHSAGNRRQEWRKHMISALTLLGCPEADARTKSYPEMADATRRYCGTEYVRQNNAELFARMVFNVFVSNDDDHLRNHAFIWQAGGWALSPLYDVMPRPSIAHERYLHLGLGQYGRQATLDNALSYHPRFSLSRRQSLDVIDRVWTEVREWRSRFEEWGVPPAQIDLVSPAFRHRDDIASRELRRELN